MPDYADERMISLLPRQKVAHRSAWKRVLRRAFDVTCALSGLALLAPVVALIALAIKFDDGGPVFYSQLRVGRGFRRFRLLKFRSMVPDPVCRAPLTAPEDTRVTQAGRFLRRYKLDELPQLWNVLKGEMRLVGVRPQVDRYVKLFRAEYHELLQDPPGITGLSTLRFRNEEQFFHEGPVEQQYIEKILPHKLKLALDYEKSRTFLSDLRILFQTVLSLASPEPRASAREIEQRSGQSPVSGIAENVYEKL